eukprot:scpid34987/ scgid27125/ 
MGTYVPPRPTRPGPGPALSQQPLLHTPLSPPPNQREPLSIRPRDASNSDELASPSTPENGTHAAVHGWRRPLPLLLRPGGASFVSSRAQYTNNALTGSPQGSSSLGTDAPTSSTASSSSGNATSTGCTSDTSSAAVHSRRSSTLERGFSAATVTKVTIPSVGNDYSTASSVSGPAAPARLPVADGVASFAASSSRGITTTAGVAAESATTGTGASASVVSVNHGEANTSSSRRSLSRVRAGADAESKTEAAREDAAEAAAATSLSLPKLPPLMNVSEYLQELRRTKTDPARIDPVRIDLTATAAATASGDGGTGNHGDGDEVAPTCTRASTAAPIAVSSASAIVASVVRSASADRDSESTAAASTAQASQACISLTGTTVTSDSGGDMPPMTVQQSSSRDQQPAARVSREKAPVSKPGSAVPERTAAALQPMSTNSNTCSATTEPIGFVDSGHRPVVADQVLAELLSMLPLATRRKLYSTAQHTAARSQLAALLTDVRCLAAPSGPFDDADAANLRQLATVAEKKLGRCASADEWRRACALHVTDVEYKSIVSRLCDGSASSAPQSTRAETTTSFGMPPPTALGHWYAKAPTHRSGSSNADTPQGKLYAAIEPPADHGVADAAMEPLTDPPSDPAVADSAVGESIADGCLCSHASEKSSSSLCAVPSPPPPPPAPLLLVCSEQTDCWNANPENLAVSDCSEPLLDFEDDSLTPCSDDDKQVGGTVKGKDPSCRSSPLRAASPAVGAQHCASQSDVHHPADGKATNPASPTKAQLLQLMNTQYPGKERKTEKDKDVLPTKT